MEIKKVVPAEPFEAVKVPKQDVYEAAKDYEEKLRKVCQWVDDKGAIDVILRFYGITFETQGGDISHIAEPGDWIVYTHSGFEVLGRELFAELYKIVE